MELTLFLAAGTLFMLFVMLYIRKYYQVVFWKTVIASILLTISGLLGARVMFWIESGRTGGVSFYGAVFFPPLLMILVALLLRISIGVMLDMCAPAECVMLALLKVKCLVDGCCGGRLLYANKNIAIRFPSQIVEMISALVLMLVLIKLIKKKKYHDQIYAWYMIMYGATRFIWNLFRDTEPFIGPLPAGNFWSIIAILIGIIWIYFYKKSRNGINCRNDN